jgi:putative oxidoreductase
MFRMLMKTQSDFATFVLRVGLGAVMWPHGVQKALGMYGGLGIEGTVKMFADNWQIPAWQAYGVIAAEFLGAIALLLGFMGRVAALGIIAVMAGAIHFVHMKNGFFNTNGGYEFPALIIVAAFVILVRGSGALSVDGMLAKRGGGAPGGA